MESDRASVRGEPVPTEGHKDNHVRMIPPGVFLCRHCGGHYAPALPCPISLVAAMSEAFSKEHDECELGERGLVCFFCFKFGHKPFDCPKLNYEGNPERWWKGPDTGASSK